MSTHLQRQGHGYLVAVAAMAAAVLLQSQLGPQAPPALLYLAVVLAAWFGGGPALLATFLGVLAAGLWLGPRGTLLGADPGARVALVAFAAAGLVVAALGEARQAARRRLEDERAELREHERRLRLTLDDASVGVAHTLPDGRFTIANRAFCQLVGYTEAELLTRTWQEITHPDDLAADLALVERARAGPISHYTREKRFVHKDGSVVWVDLFGNFVRSRGGTLAAVVVAVDITHRKRAEEALAASRAELQLVGDTAPVFIYHCDRQHRFLFINRANADRLGVRPEETVGRHIAEVIGAEAYACILPYIEQVLAGRFVECELEVPYPQGRRWMAFRYAPDVAPSGEVRGWVAVLVDATRRKQAEQALREADRRKDEFLATLAHELRNPLAPIRNALAILRLAGGESPQLQRVVELIERQVGHLVRLVDDLLEVSRIGRGKIELRKQPVELAGIVRGAVELSRPLIDAARHRLTLDLPTEPVPVEADPVRLTQVIANLLNNAAKYTEPEGRIWVTIRRDGPHAIISVRDSGVGIPAEMLPGIFDMFAQVPQSVGRSQGGLGIGLTLVRTLVELHGGAVEARSAGPGQGSEFVVRLPLATTAVEPEAAAEVPIPAVPRCVLVVDDNADAAESLATLLRLRGHDATTASDGEQALVLARAGHPDVVLLDIGLPGLDGYEVARRLRREPGLEGVLLIALTGYGQDEDRQRSREAGIDHHLVKPVDLATLQALLAEDRPAPAA